MSVSFTAGIYGFELKFTYSATTTSPAGAGELRFNNASPGSATAIYIDAEDRNSVDVSAIVAALNTNSSLLVIDENDPAVWALFTLGSVTDNTTDLTLSVTAIEAIGSFSGNISLCVAPKGATGSTESVSAATVLQKLVERGDRDRQRQTDQAQSIKATKYIGNGYVRQIGQAPTRSRYLGNAGLVPGKLVAPLGRGQQYVIIHKKPVPFFTPETIEEEPVFIPLNINVFAEIENTPSLIEELEVLDAKSLIVNIVITRTNGTEYGFVLEIRIDLLHWRLLGVLIERVERPGFGIVETDDGSASFSSSLGFFSGTATGFAAACIFGWGQVLDAVRGSLTYSVVGDGVGNPSSVNIGGPGFFEPASGIFDLLEYGTVLNSSIVSTGGSASGTFENAEHSSQVQNNTPLVCVDKGIWYVWTYFYENIGDITSRNYAVDYWVGVSGRTSVGSVKKKVYARKTIDNFPQPITFEFAFLEDFNDLTYDQFTFSPEEISIEDFRETPLSSQLIWAATRDNT